MDFRRRSMDVTGDRTAAATASISTTARTFPIRGLTKVLSAPLTCCLEARLSSSLCRQNCRQLGAKQWHSHRFLIPGDLALPTGCVKGGEAIT
jgi:hypothetical protein